MNFLTARWENLLLVNYSVNPGILQPFVPAGTQLDQFDGHVFLSLVAFLFRKTRVIGLPVPWHRCFEEVNLRFYVSPDRDRSERAVAFVKEIVPKALIPLIANRLFHENYVALPMDHGNQAGSYWYCWGNGGQNRIAVRVEAPLRFPVTGSIAEFITEHYWGYSKGPRRTLKYRVQHPQWQTCEVSNFQIDVDFSSTYGQAFSFLDSQQPYNVLFAQGSSVAVSFPLRA